jgi:glycosyltransferase involved in cell wall biosynthesis
MKILMITPFYYPIIGGSETQIENLAINLNKIGMRTDVVTFNFDEMMRPLPFEKNEIINGLRVIKKPAFNFLPIHHNKINFMVNFIPRKFNQIFKEYDVLHFHNETDLSLPLFSYKIRKPKVFHLRCLNVTYPIFKRNFVCRRLLRKIANVYIAQSKYVSSLLLDLGVPENRIKVIPNAVDIFSFYPGGEKVSNRFLYVGRIEEYKGLHVLLKSLRLVRMPVELLIIGPMVGESDYHQKIMRLMDKINNETSHNVVYLGAKKSSELLQYYQSAAVVVVPSLSESFGNVILESLACETPVIASSVGGIPEIISSYENGILVPPNNDVKLAEAIQYLLSDEFIRRRLGRCGRKLVMEKYSLEVATQKLLGVYKKLLED